MPRKTTKKARRAAPKPAPAPAPQGDGRLYKVVDADGRPIYPGTGLALHDAERLARGLRQTAAVVPVR